MDLQSKLKYYKSQTTGEKKAERAGDNPALGALAQHFHGKIINHSAPFLQIERRFTLAGFDKQIDHYGKEIELSFISRGQVDRPFSLSSALFFDLETTGLAGGAGTFPFLLGFGWIEMNELVVRQYFLPDYGREYALFSHLQEHFFPRFERFISYNGKSYDFPLLKNRFILNRLHPLFSDWPHIDLLHVVRRIWKDSFYSCDLGTIEANVLSRFRQNDIPGYYIPQAYFSFIRTGVVHDMVRIIEHNYRDIVSLAELLHLLEEIEKQPEKLNDKNARLNLARLAMEQQNEHILSKLVATFAPGSNEYNQSRFWLSLLHKKKKKWQEADVIWRELAESATFNINALEEMAKYSEHILQDHRRALQITERALRSVSALMELEHDTALSLMEIKHKFEHRRKRLKGKLA